MNTLLLALMLQAQPPATPRWSGELTLIIRGEGTVEAPSPRIGKQRTTWKVDRSAKGHVVLDRMFKGGGIAGTPSTRDTMRYETWIANSSQPLEMVVRDTGTYYGPIPGAGFSVTLDLERITCPTTTARVRPAQIRSSILQFDYVQGTYTWETPRFITACDHSTMRNPKLGPAAWMSRPPFELESETVPLEFEMVHQLTWPDTYYHVTGPFKKGDREIVLTRTFEFLWHHPIDKPAPVTGELTLVLRRTP